MGKRIRYSPEVRERSVRMVQDQEIPSLWSAIRSIAEGFVYVAFVIHVFARRSVKTEVIHRRGPWRTLEAVEYATLEWVDWYNIRRLQEPNGYLPPAEFEANYYDQLQDSPEQAGLN